MINLKEFEIWFVTGSQHLYGEETLKQVADHSTQIARSLDKDPAIPVRVVFKPVVKTPEEIYHVIFKMPKDSCTLILNIKDQVIPQDRLLHLDGVANMP